MYNNIIFVIGSPMSNKQMIKTKIVSGLCICMLTQFILSVKQSLKADSKCVLSLFLSFFLCQSTHTPFLSLLLCDRNSYCWLLYIVKVQVEDLRIGLYIQTYIKYKNQAFQLILLPFPFLIE